jgi:hypothetical protein
MDAAPSRIDDGGGPSFCRGGGEERREGVDADAGPPKGYGEPLGEGDADPKTRERPGSDDDPDPIDSARAPSGGEKGCAR